MRLPRYALDWRQVGRNENAKETRYNTGSCEADWPGAFSHGVVKAHPQHTEQIHSDAFEQLSGEVLASQGFAVEFTGRVKNLSADLIAVKKDENNEEIKYLIECKRYGAGKKVDLHIVNAVIGASYRARVKHAMLLTTSSFTSNSSQVLTDLADIRLELHDGATITEWLASYRFKRFGLWLPPGWQDVWTPKV